MDIRELLRVRFPTALGDTRMDANNEIQLDHAQRAGLLSLLCSLRPDVSTDLLNSISTWGDVLAWFPGDVGPSVDSTPFESLSPQRQAHGTRATLRPLRPQDYPYLYEAATGPDDGYRWRFRGRTPSFAEFEQTLYEGVLVQFAVEENGVLAGMVVAYNADHLGGHCYFGFFRAGERSKTSRGVMIEGAALLIEYCFGNWPFRKVYFEVPAYNVYLVQGLIDIGIARVEGVLSDYIYRNGEYCDQVFVSIDRAVWRERIGSWFNPKT